jgi:hypothetical protein
MPSLGYLRIAVRLPPWADCIVADIAHSTPEERRDALLYPEWSSTVAPGAWVLIASIPFSALAFVS